MKIFKILIFKQAQEIFKFNTLFYGDKKEKKRYLLIFCAVVLCIGVCGTYLFGNMYQVCMEFEKPQEILEYLINPLGLLAFLIIFFSSLLKGSGMLYSDRSSDILFSYPVKTICIVLAKIFFLYLWGVIISLAFLIIPILRYTILLHSILFGILDCLQIFIFPIIPMLLGVISGYILYKQIVNIYKSQVFVRSILYMVILFAFMFFMFFFFGKVDLNSIYRHILTKVDITYLVGGVFFTYKLGAALASVVALISGTVLIIYISKNYKKRYINLQINQQKGSSLNLSFKKNRKIYSLWKREIKRYLSIPIYLINTMLGNVLLLLFVIYSSIASEKVTAYFNLISELLEIQDPMVLYSYAMSLMIILTNVSYANISIEGKNREVLKSFPVSIKELLTAKYLFHLSLTVPMICLATIILGITYHMNSYEYFLCFILPLSFSAFAGALGLFINLLFPNYEWENIIYIVKQSIPAISTICLSCLIGVGMIWCIIKIFGHSIWSASYIVACILFAFAFLIIQFMKKISNNF